MAYTKNTWQTGDIVSSQKLNHMEDGIADAGGVMVINDVNGTLDKTWQEIYDAMSAGKLCIVRNDMWASNSVIAVVPVMSVAIADGDYGVSITVDNWYHASSATGYPVHKSGGEGDGGTT